MFEDRKQQNLLWGKVKGLQKCNHTVKRVKLKKQFKFFKQLLVYFETESWHINNNYVIYLRMFLFEEKNKTKTEVAGVNIFSIKNVLPFSSYERRASL